MKLIVVQVSALGYKFWESARRRTSLWSSFQCRALQPLFPALSSTLKESFRTAKSPAEHGVTADFFYDRDTALLSSGKLSISGSLPSVWKNKKICRIFWPMKNWDAQVEIQPAIEEEELSVRVNPPELAPFIRDEAGSFNLKSWQGPAASAKASRWMADAATAIISRTALNPDLLFVTLPHLEYDLLRYGPLHNKVLAQSFNQLENMLELLLEAANSSGYELLVVGDHAVSPVKKILYPNRILRESGFLTALDIKGCLHPDFAASKAFAVTDSQLAHVYVKDSRNLILIRKLFEGFSGVRKVHDGFGVNSGELIIEADPDCWFAYNWWKKSNQAPPYSFKVSSSLKAGFDPCEYTHHFSFFGAINPDPLKVHGAYGSSDLPVLWASTFKLDDSIDSMLGGITAASSLMW